MIYTLKDLIRKEHILVGLAPGSTQEIIGSLSKQLSATGYVSEEFSDDVWEREKTFPTGLPTQPVGVAIPHADPDHVYQSAVCLGVLSSPVFFNQMGMESSTQIEVNIVFLLAIKEKEKQVVMIQQLVELIQNPELLEDLLNTSLPVEAFNLIQETLELKNKPP